jgi:hypothetical protein
VIVALIHTAYSINGRCRALVLSGGSDRGAFQAGAISGLITYLPQGEAQWDVVMGTGIGAVNAMFVGQQGIGGELAVNSTISNFWLNFRRSQIYRSWFGGRFVGYYWRNGLYNSRAIKSTLAEFFEGSFERTTLIGVTDLQQSDYKIINNSRFSPEVMLLGIEANFNSKGDFAVVDYQDSQYVSGDIAFGIDVGNAIEACKKLNYVNDRYITVDIILVNHFKLAPYDAKGKNTLQNWNRFQDIQNFHNVYERMDFTKNDFNKVYYRSTIIMPDTIPVTSSYPFDYESRRNHLQTMFQSGMQTAKKALNL